MEKKDSQYCKCLYFSANALARIMTKAAKEEFAPVGLAPSYAFLLMTVNRKKDIQPGEISHEMQLTPSTVTRLIEKIEHKQLLERRSNGKYTAVQITRKGYEKVDEIKECWHNLFKR